MLVLNQQSRSNTNSTTRMKPWRGSAHSKGPYGQDGDFQSVRISDHEFHTIKESDQEFAQTHQNTMPGSKNFRTRAGGMGRLQTDHAVIQTHVIQGNAGQIDQNLLVTSSNIDLNHPNDYYNPKVKSKPERRQQKLVHTKPIKKVPNS